MSALLRIALVGAAGRMGQAIGAIAGEENAEVIAKLEIGGAIVVHNADVLIDFSSASATEAICATATESKMPMVIGTTGHSAEQRSFVELAAREIPIVLAANFSVGVNALFSLAERAAKILGDSFDVEIIEMHHRMKKDAPSGTAKAMAEVLQRGRKLNKIRHGREGMVGERDPAEIGIHSVRGGDVVGDHTVIFAGDGERLELTHRASGRETFARGALRAARWVMGRPAGLYSMRDVMAFR